ncbi:MAG: PadR family transcriptional regulator [Acidobacteria bacterium]|nr:MAG: PadR family transcriptional regulator [Acidobacteriota bacterium]RPJ63741.1 MAG: PadR family transcriptional regulator [Acidobacteriota bacterium]
MGGLGSFEEQVMLAVIRTGADAYGMSVRRELERVTRRSVTIGSVYITLDRLEAKGLVTSKRTAAGTDSPSRRVFSVTSAGAKALSETRAARDRLWDGINLQPFLREV